MSTLRLLALLTLPLVGCATAHGPAAVGQSPAAHPASHAQTINAPGIPEAWEGTWGSDDSTAVYRFVVDGARLTMDAWSTSGGEAFVLARLRWKRGAILVRTTFPSTDWTNDNEFRFEDGGLVHLFHGDGNGRSDMVRVSPEPGPAADDEGNR